MTLRRFEVGFVSTDRALVDFLAAVFELDERPPTEHGPGTLYRLQSPGAVLKVMVPVVRPSATAPQPFLAATGIRYLSAWVTDLDGVIGRATARGGRLLHGPVELGPGARLAVLADPDGNTIEVIEERAERAEETHETASR
jgi:predicted enzyme related to lactoylglutathione lyase